MTKADIWKVPEDLLKQATVEELLSYLRTTYARRPAMMDELSKL